MEVSLNGTIDVTKPPGPGPRFLGTLPVARVDVRDEMSEPTDATVGSVGAAMPVAMGSWWTSRSTPVEMP